PAASPTLLPLGKISVVSSRGFFPRPLVRRFHSSPLTRTDLPRYFSRSSLLDFFLAFSIRRRGKKSMGGLHKMNQFLYYLSFCSSGIPFDARDLSQKISRNLLSCCIISPETSKYISAFLFYFTKKIWNSPS